MEPATWVQSWPELEDWMTEPKEVVLAGEQPP
jgi:hypothetical protein